LDLFSGIVTSTTALVALLGYIGYFTSSIYPRIPAVVGGEETIRVQLILKDEPAIAPLMKLLGESSPYQFHCAHRLLFATDKTYIVVDPRDPRKAIQISKDHITAIGAAQSGTKLCVP
jgi:hypothetical protein